MPSFETLRYKLRYSPLPRLVLNGLKRVGVTILPYYFFARPISGVPRPGPDRQDARLVELHEQDMATIAALPMANSGEREFLRRLQAGQRCLALVMGDEVVSYCWMATGRCRVNGEEIVMSDDQAYAFDVYTLPARRGGHLAPILNALFTEMLYANGVRRVFSVIDYYNRPSLNFARKIGARRQRLNLYVRLFGVVDRSFLLRHIGDDNREPRQPQRPA